MNDEELQELAERRAFRDAFDRATLDLAAILYYLEKKGEDHGRDN